MMKVGFISLTSTLHIKLKSKSSTLNMLTKIEKRWYFKNDDNGALPLDKEKDGGAMVSIMSNNKVLWGKCIDSEYNQKIQDRVLPR